MMIERNLKIFRTAATVLNFTEAAELLGMSQPNVTQQMAKLERELGVMLFRRDGRTVELTAAGRALLEECGHLFALEEGILRKIRCAERERRACFLGGTVTAGSFLLVGMMEFFQREHPEFSLRLKIDRHERLLEMLSAGELDLVLSEDPGASPYFLSEHYHLDRLLPFFAPGYLKEPSFSLGDHIRRGGRVLLSEFGSGTNLAFRRFLREHGLPEPEPSQLTEASSPDAVKQLAQAGMGVALLSELATENELKAGVLAAGRFLEGEMTRPIDFLFSASGDQRFIGEFIRFCRRRKGISLRRQLRGGREVRA